MKMSKSLKKKWVKALRSGEFEQTEGILCNGKGGFCCLGVLEYVAMDGEVEWNAANRRHRGLPTAAFFEYAGIDASGHVMDDLLVMNDDMNYDSEDGRAHLFDFNVIADHIEAHVETK